MTILVTGGTGFIGSHLVRELVERGEKTIIFVRNPDIRILKSFGVNKDEITVTRGDVANMANLFAVVKKNKVNGIIHLASLLSVKTAANPTLGFDINIRGVFNVLEVARIMDVERVIYISSSSVYGSPLYEPVDEKHPTNPDDLYGATKLCGEVWGLSYSKLYDLDFVVLRLGSVYGPGQTGQPGHHMVVNLIEDAFFKKSVKWRSGADHKLNVVYAKDVASAICLSYYSKHLKHKIFNISSRKQHTVREIGDIVMRFLPDASVNIGEGVKSREKVGLMDIARANKELRYVPQYSLDDGVEDYVKWLYENEKWWRTVSLSAIEYKMS